MILFTGVHRQLRISFWVQSHKKRSLLYHDGKEKLMMPSSKARKMEHYVYHLIKSLEGRSMCFFSKLQEGVVLLQCLKDGALYELLRQVAWKGHPSQGLMDRIFYVQLYLQKESRDNILLQLLWWSTCHECLRQSCKKKYKYDSPTIILILVLDSAMWCNWIKKGATSSFIYVVYLRVFVLTL